MEDITRIPFHSQRVSVWYPFFLVLITYDLDVCWIIQHGRHLSGNHIFDEKWESARVHTIELILSGKSPEMAYFKNYSAERREAVRKVLLDGAVVVPQNLLEDINNVDILVLRGLFTYGILEHLLRKRWKVDYGVRTKPSGKCFNYALVI